MQSIDLIQGDSAVPARSRGTPPWWLIWLVFLPFGAPMIAALLLLLPVLPATGGRIRQPDGSGEYTPPIFYYQRRSHSCCTDTETS
jgi:hypothetical protein